MNWYLKMGYFDGKEVKEREKEINIEKDKIDRLW